MQSNIAINVDVVYFSMLSDEHFLVFLLVCMFFEISCNL